MTTLVSSPNAPRPAEGSLARELADMLQRIERNYGREGSGPGSRFEGQLLEDAQAGAVLRRIAEVAGQRNATYPGELVPCRCRATCGILVRRVRPFADLLDS